MKTNYHTHTTRCMHATGNDEDYVLSAIKGGYRILGFSDHTPWKYRTDYVADMRMLPEELPGYVESLKTLREKYHDQIDIRIGLECEYFPQYIHWLKEQIKKYQLDYIIFGNHHYHTDEKFPYFGHHTDSRDMLELYEESAIEGMDPVKNKCHECVPIMGVHSWLFALKKRRLLRKRSDRFVTGHLVFRKKEGGNR